MIAPLFLALLTLVQEPPLPVEPPVRVGALAPPPSVEQALPWGELVARDATVTFTPRTAFVALRDLELGILAGRRRAEALLALGLGGAQRESPRLESSAVEGPIEERCAAVLALGELGGPVGPPLLERMEDQDAEVAECALLAALRIDSASMRERVDRIAGDPGHPLAEEARRILLFTIDPASAPASRAARRLLELRYGAARSYGLIEGQSYKLLLLQRLVEDEDVLDRVVLGGAAEIDQPAVADQLFAHLLATRSETALRAVARNAPDALAKLVLHGFWQPEPEHWAPLLEEVGRERTPVAARRLLLVGLEQAPNKLVVRELLARIGELEGLESLALAQLEMPPAAQVEVAAIWGSSGSALATTPLRELSRSTEPAVRAAAFWNRARLGDGEALQAARAVVIGDDEELRSVWLEVGVRFAHDPRLQDVLEEALDELDPGPERWRLASALGAAGRTNALDMLRNSLAEGLPPGPEALDVVRALGTRPTFDDRTLLGALLPSGEGNEIDAELALGLVRARDPAVLPVLRAALWRDPFERSMLAAALVLHVGGRHTLRQELDRLPASASSRDLRRVGFAMGLFGGVEEADWLAARRGAGSGDPAVQGAYLGALAARTL